MHGIAQVNAWKSCWRCTWSRVYLEESIRTSGGFSDALEDDAAELQRMLGLGVREAEDLRSEIVSRAYKRLLREAFTSGRLDEAPSKAEVLGDLCDQLAFDSEAAAALHRQLYREKLTALAEKKKLTGWRGLLCGVPPEVLHGAPHRPPLSLLVPTSR